MVKIVVCDDSDFMRSETKKYILKYSFQREFEYSIDEYDTGEKLIASDISYDLIFMDYQFEGSGADGITIAKLLREKGVDATIIFLSSYPGVVFQSFEVGTFRFLVKPIEEDKFNDAIDAFVSNLEEKEEVLTVRVDGMTHFIKAQSISYVEGYGKYCIIHLVDKEEMECHETLATVEERLNPKYFYRCYRSYVVNLKHVVSYNHTDVLLDNGDSILISRTKYKDFLDKYSDFMVVQRR